MKSLTLILLSSISIATSAQTVEFELVLSPPPSPQYLPDFEPINNSSMAFADIDGDNDLDLLIIGRNNIFQPTSRLYTNDGFGVYTLNEETPFQGLERGSLAFADIDGDSDQDVLITGNNIDGQLNSNLYINDGTGNFSLVENTPFEGVYFSAIDFADVDGDGDPDALITGNSNIGVISHLYLNDGSGNFTLLDNPIAGIWSGDIAFIDLESDGDQDLLISGMSNSERITKLYVNDGNANFTEAPNTPFSGMKYSTIALTDIDGDADEDILISGEIYEFVSDEIYNDVITELYVNDGDGIFSLFPNAPFYDAKPNSMDFADIDGDGDQDVVFTGTSYLNDSDEEGHSTQLFSNDGSGNYSIMEGTPFQNDSGSAISFADFNGDEHPDLFISGLIGGHNQFYTNNGQGIFNKVGTPFHDVTDCSVTFVDIDGDQDQDIIISGTLGNYAGTSQLYANNGLGQYIPLQSPISNLRNSELAFADIDEDDDQDILISGLAESDTIPVLELYINDGIGNYTQIDHSFDQVLASSIAFADVDGDNDQDVMISGFSESERTCILYINDGAGNFDMSMDNTFEGVSSSSIAFSDINGDNHLDILISGRTSASTEICHLYTNDGNGVFTMEESPFEGISNGSISFADIDGDSDQDVLISGRRNLSERICELYENDGSGVFSLIMNSPFPGVGFSSTVFTDIDGDGDEDLLITGETFDFETICELYLNDGTGIFTFQETNLHGAEHGSIVAADIDGDADQDLLIAGLNNENSPSSLLWRNTSTSVGVSSERSNIGLSIYPNPTLGDFAIEFEKLEKQITVNILSMDGQFVESKKYHNIQRIEINLSLPNGIYLAEIRDGVGNKSVAKIVKSND